MALTNNTINYIELPLKDNQATKDFYGAVFGWTFTDWGETYLSFEGAGIDGGFNGVDNPEISPPGVLVILDLKATLKAIEGAGGTIIKPIFEFPGGKRFHFQDPNGNELAVWSEK